MNRYEPTGNEAAPRRLPGGRDLAELPGVPVEYVAKLFTKLQEAGLVVATEGVRGVFRLARPAESISVLDVVTATEGEKLRGIVASVIENHPDRSLAGLG